VVLVEIPLLQEQQILEVVVVVGKAIQTAQQAALAS
jgi:hypothetical protein